MVTDFLGGQVKVGVDGISAAIGYIKTGKLRAPGADDRDPHR
jgi:tripartite-type tricarboxylate transporter receptor subunit TctC